LEKEKAQRIEDKKRRTEEANRKKRGLYGMFDLRNRESGAAKEARLIREKKEENRIFAKNWMNSLTP